MNLKCYFSKLLLVAVVIGGLLTSCSSDNEPLELQSEQESLDDVKRLAEMDDMDALLSHLVINGYENDQEVIADRAISTAKSQNTYLPECVTVTVVAQQNFREVTLDFGTEGCLVRGRLLRGQLVFDYTRNPEAQEIQINYNLVDFYINARQVIGSRTVLKERENANGNPQFTHNLNLTVVWPNGLEASRSGTKVREWVEGLGSGDFTDNVFELSGNWETTFVNGNTHSYEIIDPLRDEVACATMVSGTVNVQRPNFGGILDYGDGTCDALATFTFNNGNSTIIVLD